MCGAIIALAPACGRQFLTTAAATWQPPFFLRVIDPVGAAAVLGAIIALLGCCFGPYGRAGADILRRRRTPPSSPTHTTTATAPSTNITITTPAAAPSSNPAAPPPEAAHAPQVSWVRREEGVGKKPLARGRYLEKYPEDADKASLIFKIGADLASPEFTDS
ncbi:uncharacterized protein TERG_08200 [Trichophyton rubrum CBS 118892]|uniref:Uncharacterized protein n=1 Tax=Trichophyton rubrum (strain ATCC MYA-4607 / CBS 118892) TaxID=559305 RepID=F2T062_TRIRC|nr:uncharacterized protein TERG_08200 [Trichophyton rubrum CBS 118892]EGD91984.2 hypothetical protein TERG_08200 [Trichophyton rubrum CBS 118892]